MNTRFAIMLLLCHWFIARSSAQQIPLFTQYREAQGILNPGAINYDFFTDRHQGSVGVSFRRQWSDLPNAPTTQVLRGEFFNANRTGVTLLAGGYLMNDQTGPTGFTGAYARLAGIVTSDPEYSGLSLGLSAGMVQYRIRTADLKLRQPDDIAATGDRSQTIPDIGLGLFYYQRMDGFIDDDYFYAGLSVPQVFGFDIEFPNANGNFNTKRLQHYYATIGWYHFISESSYIEPSAWVRYAVGAPVSVDLNVRYNAGGSFWLGIGSSIRGNLHAEAGVMLGRNLGFDNNFKIGYGYDHSFQSYGPFVGATHEFNVSFSF